MSRPWLHHFAIRDGALVYRQTGARLDLDAALLSDVVSGLAYYFPLRMRAALVRLLRPGPKIHFTPHEPPPCYLVWNALAWIGGRPVPRAEDADVTFFFEDATWGEDQDAAAACINGACLDVSKSHVATVFESVFGYSLALDPTSTSGLAVEKGELNGAHDGRIVACPCEAAPDKIYQRLIDTGNDAYVEDLRTPCVGGEPVTVFVKRRPKNERFANHNTSVHLADPRDLFSAAELEHIRAFARAMKLDWGGLDILRDRDSGRLYIVDVNKTDMPPLALPFADKMRSSRMLGEALRRLIAARTRDNSGSVCLVTSPHARAG